MDNKDEVIENVCTNPAGFGPIKNTLKEVNKVEPTITKEGVKDGLDNTHRTTSLRGCNSYVAPGPNRSIK